MGDDKEMDRGGAANDGDRHGAASGKERGKRTERFRVSIMDGSDAGRSL